MINLIGGEKGVPGAHAGDFQNRLLVGHGDEVRLVDRQGFESGNFDPNQPSIIATPISVTSDVTRKMVQAMRKRFDMGHVIAAGIMGVATTGPNDILAHLLFGPKAVLDSGGTEETRQHMMIFGRVTGEIDRILRHIESLGVDVHDTYPAEHNKIMAQIQVIPTLLQILLSGGEFREDFIQDNAFKLWVTPEKTLQEMIQLNEFTPPTVQEFNTLLRKTAGDLYLTLEELVKNKPSYATTPNFTRVRQYLAKVQPKLSKPLPDLSREGINTMIKLARKKIA